MRFQSYFNTAIKIIGLYDGSIPLVHFLKQYFSEHKKHGSSDRKFIKQACYNFYRLGFVLNDINTEERLKAAIFLCNAEAGGWNILYNDDWLINWNEQFQKRILFIQSIYKLSVEDIFPFGNEISEGLNNEQFAKSLLIQPYFFLRIRNQQHEKVYTALHHHNITFEKINNDCIALHNQIKIEDIIKVDEEAVIQDYSSQRIKEFLEVYKQENGNKKLEINTWDCCAGSGGKSILAFDVLQYINLTVSDVRTSIIQNLKERFKKAGIKNYTSYVVDITNSKSHIPNYKYDLIICDAPCTGSGTWSRTPEQLYFFQPDKTEAYSSLQKKITANAIKYLTQSGYFLYITCSIFKKENEAVVDYLINDLNLTLIKQELLTGYNKNADTMFAALLKLSD